MVQGYDLAIIGGGVIGCAVARAAVQKFPALKIAVIEKEDRVARHTSGRNSGVVHSGFLVKPGTLKAKMCVQGNRRLREYCKTHGVPLEEVGTVVVALDDEEERVLKELEWRGKTNEVPSVRIVDRTMLNRLEPNANGIAALYSSTGSIVNPVRLVECMADEAGHLGVNFLMGHRVLMIRERTDTFDITMSQDTLVANYLVNCAGLYADVVAHMLGVGEEYGIVPFRGEYYAVRSSGKLLVNSMIYPTPNLQFPFVGIHFTRTTEGGVIVGPNAVLAGGRESYSISDFSLTESVRTVFSSQFLRLMASPEFLKLAWRELGTSFSKLTFVEEARKLVPRLNERDLVKACSGIRAQIVDRRGRLIDDFVVEERGRAIHVLNAVSPGMTCSMPFADYIVERMDRRGFLGKR